MHGFSQGVMVSSSMASVRLLSLLLIIVWIWGGEGDSPMTNVHSFERMEVNMEDTCGLTRHGL